MESLLLVHAAHHVYCYGGQGVQPQPECPVTERRIHTALDTALAAAEQSGSLPESIWKTFLSGLQMACTIVPSILSVGLIGMLLAMYTPLFRIIGYLFYPFAALVQLPEALPAAQALATSIAEMYLPCALSWIARLPRVML